MEYFDREKNALTTGVDIAIVTPPMLSHMKLGYVDLSKLDVLILDEADRMLDMGFLGDINRVQVQCRRQPCLQRHDADRIGKLATSMLKDCDRPDRPAVLKKVRWSISSDDQKPKLLVSLLKDRGLRPSLSSPAASAASASSRSLSRPD